MGTCDQCGAQSDELIGQSLEDIKRNGWRGVICRVCYGNIVNDQLDNLREDDES